MGRPLTVLGQIGAARERRDAVENRAKILSAAKKLIKKRGFEHICMDEVAALARVGKGTLYRRFADRAALILALLDDDERALQEDVRDGLGLKRGASSAERVCALVDALLDFSIDHAPVLAAAEASARGFARFESAPYQWRHILLANGLEQCGVARGAHAGHLADLLLQALSGEVIARALTAQPADRVREQTRMFLASIVRPQERSTR